MDKITMLGTGHAMTSKCFNTCFIYENENGKLLVDTGGGQQFVTQLFKANISPDDIRYVFLSHRHTDHILGLPWLIRIRMRSLNDAPLTIIAHSELCETVRSLILLLIPEAAIHIGKTLHICPVSDRQAKTLLGRNFLFYDTHTCDVSQYGFTLMLASGEKFVFNGDVPYNEANREMMQNAVWLMHEAFCLEDNHDPKMKKHSSVGGAAKNASMLNAQNLIIIHSGDDDLESRKERYEHEASRYFSGKILVPYDLESIELFCRQT